MLVPPILPITIIPPLKVQFFSRLHLLLLVHCTATVQSSENQLQEEEEEEGLERLRDDVLAGEEAGGRIWQELG